MKKKSKVSIVVLHRGWVVVGVDEGVNDGFLRLTNASVIRRWGTTKGLGEIATDGPTKNTALDKTPTMNMPVGAIINIIDCDHAKWKEYL